MKAVWVAGVAWAFLFVKEGEVAKNKENEGVRRKVGKEEHVVPEVEFHPRL